MALKHENDQCLLSLCGTTLCRDNLVYCKGCGKALGADRYIAYMEKGEFKQAIEHADKAVELGYEVAPQILEELDTHR